MTNLIVIWEINCATPSYSRYIRNELFINSKGAPFDRNWLYAGIGYQLTDNFGMRFGAMNEFRNIKPKAQLLLSLHHKMHFGDIE